MQEKSKKQNISIVAITVGVIIIIIGITLVASSGYSELQRAESVYLGKAGLAQIDAEEYRKDGDYYTARLCDSTAKSYRDLAEDYQKKHTTRLTLCIVLCLIGTITVIYFANVYKKEKTKRRV